MKEGKLYNQSEDNSFDPDMPDLESFPIASEPKTFEPLTPQSQEPESKTPKIERTLEYSEERIFDQIKSIFEKIDGALHDKVLMAHMSLRGSPDYKVRYQEYVNGTKEELENILSEVLEIYIQNNLEHRLHFSANDLFEELSKIQQVLFENDKLELICTHINITSVFREKVIPKYQEKIESNFKPGKEGETSYRTIPLNPWELITFCRINKQKSSNYKLDLETLKTYVTHYYNGHPNLRKDPKQIEKSITELVNYLDKKGEAYDFIPTGEKENFIRELTAVALTPPIMFRAWGTSPAEGKNYDIQLDKSSSYPGCYSVCPLFDPNNTSMVLKIPHPSGGNDISIDLKDRTYLYLPESYINKGRFEIKNGGPTITLPAKTLLGLVEKKEEISKGIEGGLVQLEALSLLMEGSSNPQLLPLYVEMLGKAKSLPASADKDAFIHKINVRIEELANNLKLQAMKTEKTGDSKSISNTEIELASILRAEQSLGGTFDFNQQNSTFIHCGTPYIPVNTKTNLVDVFKEDLVCFDGLGLSEPVLGINPKKIADLDLVSLDHKGILTNKKNLQRYAAKVREVLEEKSGASTTTSKIKSDKGVQFNSLEEAIVGSYPASCREHAALVGCLLAKAVTENKDAEANVFLHGSTTDNLKAHTVTILEVEEKGTKQVILLDSTNKQKDKQVFNLSDKMELQAAIKYYADRGLPGVLRTICETYQLEHPKLDKLPPMQIELNSTQIKDFEARGWLCPLCDTPQVMLNPVLVQDGDSSFICDQLSLDLLNQGSDKQKGINPYTKKAYSKSYTITPQPQMVSDILNGLRAIFPAAERELETSAKKVNEIEMAVMSKRKSALKLPGKKREEEQTATTKKKEVGEEKLLGEKTNQGIEKNKYVITSNGKKDNEEEAVNTPVISRQKTTAQKSAYSLTTFFKENPKSIPGQIASSISAISIATVTDALIAVALKEALCRGIDHFFDTNFLENSQNFIEEKLGFWKETATIAIPVLVVIGLFALYIAYRAEKNHANNPKAKNHSDQTPLLNTSNTSSST